MNVTSKVISFVTAIHYQLWSIYSLGSPSACPLGITPSRLPLVSRICILNFCLSLFSSIAAYFENDYSNPTESTQYLPFIQNHCNVEGIQFPISLNDIKKFVDQNLKLDLKISIYYEHGGSLKPWLSGYKHQDMPGTNEINLYLAFPSSFDDVVLMDGHFMLIQDRDLFFQRTKPCGRYNKRFHCSDCMRAFTREIYHQEHKRELVCARGVISDKLFFIWM